MQQKQKVGLIIAAIVVVFIVVISLSVGKRSDAPVTADGATTAAETPTTTTQPELPEVAGDMKAYSVECLLTNGSIALGRATFDEDVDPNTADEFELINRNTGEGRTIAAADRNSCTFTEED